MRSKNRPSAFFLAALTLTATTGIGLGIGGSPPATAAPPPTAEAALDFLEAQLAAAGGTMPSPYGPGSDWGLTLDAVLALSAGDRAADAATTTALAEVEANLDDYIAWSGDPGSLYAGPLGKTMLGAVLAGADVNSFGGRDLEALARTTITTSGIDQGRFSDISIYGNNSNGFGQALNVMALSHTPDGVPTDAIDFLLAQQCPAGGFRLFYGTTRGCENDTQIDPDATAMALSALVVLPSGPEKNDAIDAAIAWLESVQDVDGGFVNPFTGVNTNTTGLAAQALRVVGQPAMADAAAGFVESVQFTAADVADGTPAATFEGAIALNQGGYADAIVGGIDPNSEDQFRRSTAQAVLALGLSGWAVPTGPVTTITSTPSTTDTSTSIAFTLDDAAASATCRLDGGAWEPCTSPRALSGLPLGTHTFEVRGVDKFGIAGETASTTWAINSSAVVGVQPARLLDTRVGGTTVDGLQAGTGPVAPGSQVVLQVAGRGTVPLDATSVVLNITADRGTGQGYVTVYPCDAPLPLASSLNFSTDAPVPNAVFVKLSASGTACLRVAESAVDLIADVNGFFPAGSDFGAVTPARLLDTRAGTATIDGTQVGTGPLTPGTTVVLPVAGRGGTPVDASSAVLNITADRGSGTGYVTVYPCDAPRPLASSLNYSTGTPAPNAVITKLSTIGTVCLFVAEATVDLIVDVNGFFPAGSDYGALTPARLLDSRVGGATADGAQVGAGPLAAGTTVTLPVTGRGGVPADAGSVVLNVTADRGTGTGYVTVYPCDATRPLASSLNFSTSGPVPNAVISKLSATGTVCLFVAEAAVELIVDVNGSFG